MIKKLCTCINISFKDILLKLTYFCDKWNGNGIRDYAYSKIESSQMNSWQSDIRPMKIIYINKLFTFDLKDYNYSRIEINGSFLKRVKGDYLKDIVPIGSIIFSCMILKILRDLHLYVRKSKKNS